MDERPSADASERRAEVLARATLATSEDPFGPGDPLEVARLVRRVLAAAGRKAVDVAQLVVVADVPAPSDALARFTRRALGPHGGTIKTSAHLDVATDHDGRERRTVAGLRLPAGGVTVLVVLGPGDHATAVCVG